MSMTEEAATRRERVFRGRSLSFIAGAGMAGCLAFQPAFAAHHVHGMLAGGFIFSLFIYFLWLLGWHSAIRLRPHGVVVDNLLVRHEIPWSELKPFEVGYGLVVRLRDGGKIDSLAFGGSVAGHLLGYPYTRKIVARMNGARDELLGDGMVVVSPSSPGYVRRSGFSPWPLLGIVAATEAIAGLSLLIGGTP